VKNWVADEVSRLKNLYEKESIFIKKGSTIIAGVDEVGRGPMAGPVVAAAVVFEKPLFLPGLDDSKKVHEDIREILFEIIKRQALSYSIGIAHVEEIEKLNVLHASLLAMSRALEKLGHEPLVVMVDGNQLIPGINCIQETVIKGDSRVYSIAAASTFAKVTRDRLMNEYDTTYTGYDFTRNKGYCTKAHLEALQKLGPSPIHRKGYRPVKNLASKAEQLVFI
jgi:ribonuclease HII